MNATTRMTFSVNARLYRPKRQMQKLLAGFRGFFKFFRQTAHIESKNVR